MPINYLGQIYLSIANRDRKKKTKNEFAQQFLPRFSIFAFWCVSLIKRSSGFLFKPKPNNFKVNKVHHTESDYNNDMNKKPTRYLNILYEVTNIVFQAYKHQHISSY